jgi:hypothetical protein
MLMGLTDNLLQKMELGFRIPARIGGQHSWRIRYQGELLRFGFENQCQKGRIRIALNVEFGGHQRFQVSDVGIPDVALVGPGMYGNPLSPKGLNIHHHLQQIRIVSAPGISQGGQFVDVYT